MSDLGWRAEGIERARAAGGVELERYRRPGFIGGIGVRRLADSYCCGFDASSPDGDEDTYIDPTPQLWQRRRRR